MARFHWVSNRNTRGIDNNGERAMGKWYRAMTVAMDALCFVVGLGFGGWMLSVLVGLAAARGMV